MLTCEKCRNRLSAYLDGELSALELALVEGHLSVCEACSAVLTDMKRLEPLLCSLDVPPAPPDLTSRILTEARTRQQSGSENRLRSRRHPLSIQFLKHISPAAAALILGLSVGAYMGLTGLQNNAMKTTTTRITENQVSEEHLYAVNILGPVPSGSVEAAVLALMEDER